MDTVSSCKDKLAYFRLKELKDVLTQLGVPKQGKKQDLANKIIALLSDDQALKLHCWPKKISIAKERIVKIIDDTYRKMQIPGATELASKEQTESENMMPEEVDNSLQLDMKVQCLCGSPLPTDSMIQCVDPRCHVWQHIDCVIIREKPSDSTPDPSQFYCEMCRIKWADPFWLTLDHPLKPVKLTVSSLTTDGTNPVQNVDKTFTLTRAHRDLLHKVEFDVQAWCILLNDKVSFRMQWPQFSDLQVNGVPVRTVNRPGTQLLGANGRDDGPVITTCTGEGTNKIFLSGCDARPFCFGVRIAKRRTVQQVLGMIPKESEGEPFDDALGRVCRCIGGGNAAENADSDSDIEVVAESITVNLRCPLSGSRMKTAGRFKPCVHMGCFDLETFVELNQRSRKWQCPICLKNYSLEHVIVDPYFNRITKLMRDCGEDVNEIDVKPDGSWRAKNEHERKDLAQWHLPNGSLAVAGEVKSDLENSKLKQEVLSGGHNGLKLGIRKNQNGVWEVSKPEGGHSSDIHPIKVENPNVIPMSSSATGSCKEGEDLSVNQDGGGLFGFSTNNGNELDTVSFNFDPTRTFASNVLSAPSAVADVIVLSDSEDENANLTTVCKSNQANSAGDLFSVSQSGNLDSYPDDPHLGPGGSSLNFLNGNGDDFGMPLWPMPSTTHAGPGFQLFGTETNVSDSLIDVEPTSVSTSMNGYGLAPEIAVASVNQVLDSNTELDTGLVDNPLAFDVDDPSLQIFLPPRPADSSVQVDMKDQPDTSNGSRADDWISLRLGGSGSGNGSSIGHIEPGTSNGLISRSQVPLEEGRSSLANTASLLLSMSDNRPANANTKRQLSDSFSSHPRQPRSVRRRYFPSESDSE